jgi:hypothetical protein
MSLGASENREAKFVNFKKTFCFLFRSQIFFQNHLNLYYTPHLRDEARTRAVSNSSILLKFALFLNINT